MMTSVEKVQHLGSICGNTPSTLPALTPQKKKQFLKKLLRYLKYIAIQGLVVVINITIIILIRRIPQIFNQQTFEIFGTQLMFPTAFNANFIAVLIAALISAASIRIFRSFHNSFTKKTNENQVNEKQIKKNQNLAIYILSIFVIEVAQTVIREIRLVFQGAMNSATNSALFIYLAIIVLFTSSFIEKLLKRLKTASDKRFFKTQSRIPPLWRTIKNSAIILIPTTLITIGFSYALKIHGVSFDIEFYVFDNERINFFNVNNSNIFIMFFDILIITFFLRTFLNSNSELIFCKSEKTKIAEKYMPKTSFYKKCYKNFWRSFKLAGVTSISIFILTSMYNSLEKMKNATNIVLFGLILVVVTLISTIYSMKTLDIEMPDIAKYEQEAIVETSETNTQIDVSADTPDKKIQKVTTVEQAIRDELKI